jgi:hypothetical protein
MRATKRQHDAKRNQSNERHSKQNLTLELSGGGAVRLDEMLDSSKLPNGWPTRYCCFVCRAMPKRLWPARHERTAGDESGVAKTAHANEREDARCANARETRETT